MNISQRLHISPYKRLQKLVDELDIIDGIDDYLLAKIVIDDDEDEDLEVVDNIT